MLNFLRNIGFTKQDLLLLFFLLGVFIIGLVVRYSGFAGDLHFGYKNQNVALEQQMRTSFDESIGQDKGPRLSQLKDSLENVRDKSKSSSLSAGTKINLNTAYASELIVLPGVGEVTAERIISYREKKGGFKNIAQIMDVKGIGTKKFEKLKEYITVK
jgi:comEA protein